MKKIITSLLVLFCLTSQAQITINIRYNAPKSVIPFATSGGSGVEKSVS